MKPIVLLSTMVLLLCGSSGLAQVADDPPQTRPMTRYEKAITKIDNLNDLKTAYDTLKTDYDRRYFLHALPGYFADRKIKTVPDWVEKAVLAGIESKKPLYICEAVLTAGALGINYSNQLMSFYPAIHSTFGCHEDMLKSAIITSLTGMENANKKKFFLTILTSNTEPLSSATFNALLSALMKEADPMFSPKLQECSAFLGSETARIASGTDKEEKQALAKIEEIKTRIDLVQKKIERSKQGGAQ